MGMGFAPTWLRQVTPPASENHFNMWSRLNEDTVEAVKILRRGKRAGLVDY